MNSFWLRRAIDTVVPGIAATVVITCGLVAPVAAQVSTEPAAPVYGMTPERTVASTAVVLALISAIIGGLSLTRAVRRIGNGGSNGAIVALVLGPIALIVGGLVVATADGGLGTGNGVAGGFVAMAVAVIGIALGGLARVRSGRIA